MSESKSLATELLHELKEQNKRLFRALIVLGISFSVLLVVSICGFLWYISLPTGAVQMESKGDANYSYVGSDMKGDITYGKE